MPANGKIAEAIEILAELGMPRGQQNERSALCLLALVNLTETRPWSQAANPLVGITPMMDFARKHFGKSYAPNTRETFRRQTMHQLVDAGIAVYNPDNPARAVNSPKAVYQIDADALALLKTFRTPEWAGRLKQYLKYRPALTARYAQVRDIHRLPVKLAGGSEIKLSPGSHSQLIKAIIEEFAPRFAPGARVVYAGDTGDKWVYFDHELLATLGVTLDGHGKMPDVVLFWEEKNWLLLIESVTSHGPVDSKRHHELARLFRECKAGLVYVTAFPSRAVMMKYLVDIAWETEVWCADSPTHLIHFNGPRFLGPYDEEGW